jgi:Kef-type K+ transport system membrane component KefB
VTSSVHQSETLVFSILLQLIIMIGAARVMNSVARRLGQPGVVGEIIAGLLLGPSLLGHFLPGLSSALFAPGASTPIVVISQIGLILLMFQIGMDFELAHLTRARNARAAIIIAVVSVAVPLGLGLLIGHISAPILAGAIDGWSYSLFCGVGLAITAVPVLGRILREYGLTHTEVGVVAISAAALNDVLGWLLLAGISAYAAARFSGVGMTLQVAGVAGFGVVMWFVIRPLMHRLLGRYPPREGTLDPVLMGAVLCLLFAAGICTYQLGIFAIFGGFAAGVLFHGKEAFRTAWHRQVGQFVIVFFLPVFFTFTGLRTNVLGLTTWSDLSWLSVLLGAAIAGKIVPTYLTSRASGFDRNQSWLLGSLMNTRGLMELIVLNIGFDMGFIPQQVFTMLVIMATVTTVMTGPLLRALLARTGHAVPDGVQA